MWWTQNMTNQDIDQLIGIFNKYLRKNKEVTGMVRTVKELFSKNIRNRRELSKIIDKYLIPHEREKKINAEVSTPYALRQEMLDKIPTEFWTKPRRVFEPCCGKAGFLIDIMDRFMTGLERHEPNEKKRYKLIVEECLYWSDINKLNILICRLLLDPYGKYKLQYNVGSTLDLDVRHKWSLNGFDAVIGNPPYNNGKNSNFYVDFMDFAYNNLVYGGLNLYVVPNRFLIPKHRANESLQQFNVFIIKHTVKSFNVSTDIGYYLAKKTNKPNITVPCIFTSLKNPHVEIIREINLNIPTPSVNSTVEYKELSDKILNNKLEKLEFIKGDKHIIDKKCHIFLPRHWTRYSDHKDKGGKHIFNVLSEFGDDGRYVKVNKTTRGNIIWYLTRSKVIRFITNNYASTVFIPPFIWVSIPKINFNIKHTDNELYTIFGLTKYEKQLIESVVA